MLGVRAAGSASSRPPGLLSPSLRPAIPELVGNTSLFTRELCDECAKQFADTIDAEFARFWESLEALRAGTASFREIRAPTAIPIAAYKSLIRMALSLMPEQELSSFADTIEWVSNPDHAFDRSLFDNAGCLVYQAHVPFRAAWVCLSCRTEKDAPFPYMLFFLGAERLILQVHLPLCALDEDLDGTEVHMPQRSFSTGTGLRLAAQHLSGPASRSRPPIPRELAASGSSCDGAVLDDPFKQPTLASGSSVRLISSSAFSSQARAGVKGRHIISKARSSFDRRVSRARKGRSEQPSRPLAGQSPKE